MNGVSAASLEACLWPLDRRDELTARLAGVAGLATLGPSERFELGYADVTPTLSARARALAPAVLRAGPGAGLLLGVAGFEPGRVRLLGLDGTPVVCDAGALAAWLRAPVEQETRRALAAAVTEAGIAGDRGAAATEALCLAALGAERLAEGVRLAAPAPSFGAALRARGLGRRLGLALAGYLGQLAIVTGLWWLVGARAVAAADSPAGAGFVALVSALVAARLASSWTAGRLAIDVGETLRGRLLEGILALDAETVRSEGIGQLLGRVVDTEALEALALGGGLVAAAGLFELLTGVVILTLGLGARWQLPLLAAWLALALALATRAGRALGRQTALRVALTHDLVERLVGQRTLVAQQPPELRHREEDAALADYAAAGGAVDRALSTLAVVVPRGWLLAAVAVLAPWLADAAARPGAFAISLGGVLFVYGALRKLTQAFPALAAAGLAWRQAAPLLRAERPGEAGEKAVTTRSSPSAPAETDGAPPLAPPFLVARDLAFRYPGRAEPVLSGCWFEIRRGDRVLLEGASGGGKSTLGSIVAGLRLPDSGALRLDGIDQRALGAARWRSRIGSAPQFHDNHLFSASLLFNLLLGRVWPPRREDVAEAEEVLRELDLGPLLSRMPSGLEQLVGESGWQLSHGERSRVYIARALLQPLEARVLDESFAALDPETLEKALACVLRRASTLVVIAHP